MRVQAVYYHIKWEQKKQCGRNNHKSELQIRRRESHADLTKKRRKECVLGLMGNVVSVLLLVLTSHHQKAVLVFVLSMPISPHLIR